MSWKTSSLNSTFGIAGLYVMLSRNFWNVAMLQAGNAKWKCSHGLSGGAVTCLPALVVLFCLCLHFFFFLKEAIKPAQSVSHLTAQPKEVLGLFTFTHNSCELLVPTWVFSKNNSLAVSSKVLIFLAFWLDITIGGLFIVLLVLNIEIEYKFNLGL